VNRQNAKTPKRQNAKTPERQNARTPERQKREMGFLVLRREATLNFHSLAINAPHFSASSRAGFATTKFSCCSLALIPPSGDALGSGSSGVLAFWRLKSGSALSGHGALLCAALLERERPLFPAGAAFRA
jgi:hypothetical protein